MDLCLVQRFIPLYSGAFVEFGALKYVSLSLSYLPSERREGMRRRDQPTMTECWLQEGERGTGSEELRLWISV